MHSRASPMRTRGDRIAITLGLLAVLYAGSWVMLPGLDTSILSNPSHPAFAQDMVVRLSIMALGAVPLVSAAALLELLRILSPWFRRALPGDIDDSEFKTAIFFLGLGFTVVQAHGIALGLEGIPNLVSEPGPLFRTKILLVLAAATAAHAYAAHLMDRCGAGSGLWVISALSILASLPLLALLVIQGVSELGLEVGLTPLVFGALTVGITLGLISKDRTLVSTGQLLWPAVVAPVAFVGLLLALALIPALEAVLVWIGMAQAGNTGFETGKAQALSIIEAISAPQSLVPVIALPLLFAALMLLRDRSLCKAGLPTARTTRQAALILATLTGAGLYAGVRIGTVLRLDALSLIMLTALAVTVTDRLRACDRGPSAPSPRSRALP